MEKFENLEHFPKQFPRPSSGARPFSQALGVIYEIQWALRQYDPGIGECL
jgi:hypothetical protein